MPKPENLFGEDKENKDDFFKEVLKEVIGKLKKYYPKLCILFWLGIGIYISPYAKGFIALAYTAKQAVDKQLESEKETVNNQLEFDTDQSRDSASEKESCFDYSPVKLYIKKEKKEM